MSDTFLTFEKFADPELAATIAAQLEAHEADGSYIAEVRVPFE